jgi:hypothetical protein
MRHAQEAPEQNPFLDDPPPAKPLLARAFRKARRVCARLARRLLRVFPSTDPDAAEMLQTIQECNLVLNEVVRDLSRLQSRVELLQQTVEQSFAANRYGRDAGQQRAG